MKTLKNIMLMMTLTTSALGADVHWAKAQFWQSPYLASTVAKIVNTNSELTKACQDLHKLTYDQNGQVKVDRAWAWDLVRKRPLVNSLGRNFVAEISTNLTMDSDILSDEGRRVLSDISDRVAAKDHLPGFTQKTQELLLDYSSVGNLELQVSEKSFSHLSQTLGLKLNPVQLIQKRNELQLQVTSLDTACDLISGQAQVSFVVEAMTKIDHDEYIKVKDLYNSIADAYTEILKKPRSFRSQAALLGTKIAGQLVKNPTNSNDKIETYIDGLMEFLFVDSYLNLSSVWKKNSQSFEIPSVYGTSQPVKMKLILK